MVKMEISDDTLSQEPYRETSGNSNQEDYCNAYVFCELPLACPGSRPGRFANIRYAFSIVTCRVQVTDFHQNQRII